MIWLIFIISCLTLKPLNAQKARICTTPDKKTGTCIPIKLCRPMVDYLQDVPSVTPEITKQLTKYRCDPTKKDIMVCCPNDPITLKLPHKREKFEPKSCATPQKRIGTCVPILMCNPMVDYLKHVRPITKEIAETLNKFRCGLTQNDITVCCPNEPIIINEERKMFTRNNIQHRNIDLLPENCGPLPAGNQIIGGNKTTLFEFPWMALLAYRSQNAVKFKCGGSIINSRYILTAAHCVRDLANDKLIFVRSGEYIISSYFDCQGHKCAAPVQDRTIQQIISHPKYKRATLINDIALIRLAVPLNFAVASVKPICLPADNEQRNVDLTGRLLTVTGWGLTKSGLRSDELLKADIRITRHQDCKRKYARYSQGLYDTQLCGGGGKVDACGGDSGGPLQRIDSFQDEDRFVQYGLVSFGPQCGTIELPGVYTKTGPYLEWILDNLKP